MANYDKWPKSKLFAARDLFATEVPGRPTTRTFLPKEAAPEGLTSHRTAESSRASTSWSPLKGRWTATSWNSSKDTHTPHQRSPSSTFCTIMLTNYKINHLWLERTLTDCKKALYRHLRTIDVQMPTSDSYLPELLSFAIGTTTNTTPPWFSETYME